MAVQPQYPASNVVIPGDHSNRCLTFFFPLSPQSNDAFKMHTRMHEIIFFSRVVVVIDGERDDVVLPREFGSSCNPACRFT